MTDDTLIPVPLRPTDAMVSVAVSTARVFGVNLTYEEAYTILATVIETYIQEQDI